MTDLRPTSRTETAPRETDPRETARNIPLATDRLLVQLGNDLLVSAHQVQVRADGGFFVRLWTWISGQDGRRRDDATTSMTRAQQATVAWMKELAERHRATNLALTDFAECLATVSAQLPAVSAAGLPAAETARLEKTRLEVRELAGIVAELIDEVNGRLAMYHWRLDGHDNMLAQHGQRLAELDRRVLRTELWQAGWADQEDAVRRWESQGAYANLPWIAQVVLLAREVASSNAGLFAYATGDDSFRHRLEQRVLAAPQTTRWPRTKALESLLNDAAEETASDDHRMMVAELLGVGLPADATIPCGPLTAALATTMQLRAQPAADWPANVAADALQRLTTYIPPAMTVNELIRHAVGEQVEAVHQRRRTLQQRRNND